MHVGSRKPHERVGNTPKRSRRGIGENSAYHNVITTLYSPRLRTLFVWLEKHYTSSPEAQSCETPNQCPARNQEKENQRDFANLPKHVKRPVYFQIGFPVYNHHARGCVFRYNRVNCAAFKCVYRCVVLTRECPRSSWITRRSAPRSSKCVANE